MRKADAALSAIAIKTSKILYKGRCPLCGCDPTEPVPRKDGKGFRRNRWVCFHFVRRRRKSTRWKFYNVVGACEFCNLRERGDPDPSRAWYVEAHGRDAYLSLVRESRIDFEPTEEWLATAIMELDKTLMILEGKGGDAAEAAPRGDGRSQEGGDGLGPEDGAEPAQAP